ncbi:MAG TPA: N-acetyl-gamma-glutamyl-phosphate reductase [Desulfobacteraceae bacterium]|nr:N-acetyl-gamma-glutamyl-phosphate reductase [Desulfobacteraceae bacterium]
MIRAGVCGATGYTGAEIVKLISNHPKAELAAVTSRSYSGETMGEVFPAMRNLVDLTCEEINIDKLKQRIDCVFLALPHKTSMAYAPLFAENNIKVIDLSADFRFTDAAAYEAAYQEHSAKALLEKSVYGLSEIYRSQIAKADIVGNPGCYPTSFLLPVLPLVTEKLIDNHGIISDSKSGVSGAGRSVSLATHYCETNESFKPYKINAHRHVPEMEEVLSIHAGSKTRITFVPHLLPATRGMLSTIYARACDGTTDESIRKTFTSCYGTNSFVRILPPGKFPDIAHVRGTNFCDIGFSLDRTTGQLILVSAIDNLLKGAAGQAVQNMNLMFGIDEKSGLTATPGAI